MGSLLEQHGIALSVLPSGAAMLVIGLLQLLKYLSLYFAKILIPYLLSVGSLFFALEPQLVNVLLLYVTTCQKFHSRCFGYFEFYFPGKPPFPQLILHMTWILESSPRSPLITLCDQSQTHIEYG